jgi:hypothetical protein
VVRKDDRYPFERDWGIRHRREALRESSGLSGVELGPMDEANQILWSIEHAAQEAINRS